MLCLFLNRFSYLIKCIRTKNLTVLKSQNPNIF